MERKIVLSLFYMGIITAIVGIVITTVSYYGFFRREVEENLVHECRLVAESYDKLSSADELERFSGEDFRITLIDKDGYVKVIGRRNRTIVLSSGKKVAPEELENLLAGLPGLLEVLVTGEGETRQLTAEVYSALPEKAVHDQIDTINRTLPIYKRIRRVVVRKEPFPRTASGKIKV